MRIEIKKILLIIFISLFGFTVIACDQKTEEIYRIKSLNIEESPDGNFYIVTFFIEDMDHLIVKNLDIDMGIIMKDIRDTVTYQQVFDLENGDYSFNKEVLIMLPIADIQGGYTNEGTIEINLTKDDVQKDIKTISVDYLPCGDKFQAIYDYFSSHGVSVETIDELGTLEAYKISTVKEDHQYIFTVYENGLINIKTEFHSTLYDLDYTNTVEFMYTDEGTYAGSVSLYVSVTGIEVYGIDMESVISRTLECNIVFDNSDFETAMDKMSYEEVSNRLSENSMNAMRNFVHHSIGVIF